MAKPPATKGSLSGCRIGRKFCGERKRSVVKRRSAKNGSRLDGSPKAAAEEASRLGGHGRHHGPLAPGVGVAAGPAAPRLKLFSGEGWSGVVVISVLA